MNQGEIILYQPDKSLRLEVRFDGDNVWLNRLQLAELFDRDVKTIGKHINNALKEELDNVPVVAKFATTAADGKVYQTEHYNLDDKEVYHIGASLKDLGKKMFAFSKLKIDARVITEKL